MDLLLQELVQVYNADNCGAPLALKPVAAQFTDYVRWHLGAVHGPRGQRSWEYWRQQLAGELPVLNLPTDYPRPRVQTYKGTSHSWELESSQIQRLRMLVKEQGATSFMALLAVFQIVLYRYTGQEDFLVGTATADRAVPNGNIPLAIFSINWPCGKRLRRNLSRLFLGGRGIRSTKRWTTRTFPLACS